MHMGFFSWLHPEITRWTHPQTKANKSMEMSVI